MSSGLTERAGVRLALITAVAFACWLGSASSALAVPLHYNSGVGLFDIVGDDAAGDSISLDCVSGNTQVPGATGSPVPCGSFSSLFVEGFGGNDTINLSAVTLDKFPALTSIVIKPGSGTDGVTGTPLDDEVEADSNDAVSTGLGDDHITGGGQILAGPGEDLIENVSGSVDAGAGNDRLETVVLGPVEGGSGVDIVDDDLGSNNPLDGYRFDVADDGVDATFMGGSGPLVDWNAIERFEFGTTNGSETVDASGFTGVLQLEARAGNDTVVGGAGADVIRGGSGSDDLRGGPGGDYVDGGADSDTLNLRDDAPDVGVCGDGADTAVADQDDGLTDCETVDRLDKVPPFTLDLSGPTSIKQGKKAKFSFGSSEAGGTFTCQVDKKPASPCTSPFKLKTKKLDPGKHTFAVAAVDAAGNADPTPATLKFTVQKKKGKS
jgi:Ca2+-binding RTX toxin-like protein